jgi:4-aminobutyrate aminotransferase-like enzyme
MQTSTTHFIHVLLACCLSCVMRYLPLALIAARRAFIGSNLSISYEAEGGLHVTRGVGAYLFTTDGRVYLDAVNNVSHVGHSNALVNERLQQQQMRINTNTVRKERGRRTHQANRERQRKRTSHSVSCIRCSLFATTSAVCAVTVSVSAI